MPATATHAIFAMDVYNELPNTIKQLIDKNTFQYKMFSQSTDSLMFYNIESLKSGKKVRELQHTFHTSKSRSFFITLVEYIKRNKLYDNSYVMVFLYGFICHYVLIVMFILLFFIRQDYLIKKIKIVINITTCMLLWKLILIII